LPHIRGLVATRRDCGGTDAVRRRAGTGGQRGTPHNPVMATLTVTTGIDRTGPAVREALLLRDSQAGTRFEAEFHAAIAEANPDPEADAV